MRVLRKGSRRVLGRLPGMARGGGLGGHDERTLLLKRTPRQAGEGLNKALEVVYGLQIMVAGVAGGVNLGKRPDTPQVCRLVATPLRWLRLCCIPLCVRDNEGDGDGFQPSFARRLPPTLAALASARWRDAAWCHWPERAGRAGHSCRKRREMRPTGSFLRARWVIAGKGPPQRLQRSPAA